MWSQAFYGIWFGREILLCDTSVQKNKCSTHPFLAFSLLFPIAVLKGKKIRQQRHKNWFSILQLMFAVLICACSLCGVTNLSCYRDGLNTSGLLLKLSCCWLTCSYPDHCSLTEYRLIQKFLGSCAFDNLCICKQKKINCSRIDWSVQQNLMFSWLENQTKTEHWRRRNYRCCKHENIFLKWVLVFCHEGSIPFLH